MLINFTSTEQTIYISISDVHGSFCNCGGQGRSQPQMCGEGGDMVSILQLLGSPKRYFMYFRHVFHRFGIFYIIDENIKRLQPPPPPVSPKCWKNFKIDSEEKCGAQGGGHIIMISGHLSWFEE
jgi:hypothetical protein